MLEPIEPFKCEIDIKPIKDWLQEEETEDHCPPCLLQPLAELYLGELEGDEASTAALREAWGTGDALTIAEAMDNIKEQVGGDLQNRLKNLDCMAQSFKESAAEEQQ